MEKVKFKDRIAKYPNRKKLKIISKSESEIVAEIEPADEPQVEGTEINAKLLNKWQEVISTSEDNAMLAKNKVHIAEENAKLAVKYSKEAIEKAEQAELVADYVSKSVNNTFIPIKTSELFNDNQFISAREQDLTEEEKTQARLNIGAGTSNFSGNYDDLTNKPNIPSYDTIPTKDYVDGKISDLINMAPETLDTLGEIASALQDNESVIESLNTAINTKVDKVEGKGLSSNDFTTEEKEKLLGIELEADKNVQSDWAQTDSTSDDFIKNKPVIPTKLSELNNDSGFVGESSIQSAVESAIDSIIDDNLSTTSTNAVQNKIITNKINEILNIKANVSDIPTKLSELINDSGFIDNNGVETIIQNHIDNSLSSTSTNAVQNKVVAVSIADLENSKANISDIPTKTSDLSNDNGFVNEDSVLTIIQNKTDNALSSTSVNAVQNKIITEQINNLTASVQSLNNIMGSKTLLWSGNVGTTGTTITLTENVTNYDALLLCGHAWSNTGFIFLVGTTKLQPAYTSNYTSATYNSGQTGNGSKGTSFFVSIRLNNSNNQVYFQTGYDNTSSSNQGYLQRIYGINFGG